MSPWAAAVALEEGVEPVVHVGRRDRNRLARAVRDLDVVDLIGLAAEEFCVLAAGIDVPVLVDVSVVGPRRWRSRSSTASGEVPRSG